jgi:hypothetical protein
MNNIIFLLLAFQFLQPTFLGLESITEFIPYATIYMVTWYIPFIFFKTGKANRNQIGSTSNYFMYFVLLSYAVLTSVTHNQFSLKSFVLIFSPITCVHIFAFYQQRIGLDLKPSNQTFKFAWIVWMIALLFQLALPSVYTIFSDLFLPRANILVDDRGLSGLATEPSFSAEIMMLFYMVWRLKMSELKPKENYFFLITLAIAILLNGSATIYGLAIVCIATELIVKKIHSFVEERRLHKAASLHNPLPPKSIGRSLKAIPAIALLLSLVIILSLVFGFQLPPRLASIFSVENTQYTSFKDFIYKFTLVGMGSWRSISNYAGFQLGMNNLPFGKGLGSGDVLLSDYISDNFGSYDSTLHTWVTTTFTFIPFTMSDLGLVFCVLLFYYVYAETRLLLLLRDYPLKGAMVITGLVCVTIVSPKSSLTPWFIMLYAADEVRSTIPKDERFEEPAIVSILKGSRIGMAFSRITTKIKSQLVTGIKSQLITGIKSQIITKIKVSTSKLHQPAKSALKQPRTKKPPVSSDPVGLEELRETLKELTKQDKK